MERLIRVFIADASPDTLELLRAALEQDGDVAVVGLARSGDEALRRYPDSGAEVLLTELLLPGLDGLSLLRQLKEDGVLRHAIVLSGFCNDYVTRAVSPLADDFLLKPCRASDLLRHVRACALSDEGGFVRNDVSSVTRALLDCGVPQHLNGFDYLREGLLRVLADRSLLRGVTKSLYRDIARRFDTTPVCVERSIRSAVERAWQRVGPSERRRRFGPLFDPYENPPSNVPFLTAMTEYLEGGYPDAETGRPGEKARKQASFN